MARVTNSDDQADAIGLEEEDDPLARAGAYIIVCLGFAKDGDAQRIADLKRALCRSPLVLHHVEATGAYDLVLEVAAIDAATYYRWLLATTAPYADLVVKEEASFSERSLVEEDTDVVVWVPEDHGILGLRREAIDRIVAEGDYVRVHAGSREWQLHATLQSYADKLEARGFVRVHRSVLVRTSGIVRMVRESARWLVQLECGRHEPVARTRVTAVKAALNDRSSNIFSSSPRE